MKQVEQVDINGNILIDYDNKLARNELFDLVQRVFPNVYKDAEGMISGDYKGKKYSIRVKNITYLGHPHPIYKKRIQISDDLQEFYIRSKRKGLVPILLGVYTYKDVVVFCDFNIEDFINKKAHNSSAHVFTENIAAAVESGFCFKEDYYGNRITVFTKENVKAFLEERLNDRDIKIEEKEIYDNSESAIISRVYPIEKIVLDFFASINKEWWGINCYNEMIDANYRNKYQPEWPGFYLEYCFEKYLTENNCKQNIEFYQNKRKGGIDLDLYFPSIDMYGDLKAHSNASKGIQGNDWDTVFGLLHRTGKDNHIFYIVGSHDTKKDALCDYEVTIFWNKKQNKENLMSYSNRMKNSVLFTHAYIFDINNSNKQYLTKFSQGINSNGKPRAPKIMIEESNYSKFLSAEQKL